MSIEYGGAVKKSSDYKFFAKLFGNNEEAKDYIYRTYSNPIRQAIWITIKKYGYTESYSDDILSSFFSKCFENDLKKLKQYRGDSKFGTYLNMIAFHFTTKYLDKYAEKKYKSLESLDKALYDENENKYTLYDILPHNSPEPLEYLDKREIRSIVRQTIKTLPKIYRGVFVDQNYKNHSTEEIAKKYGIKTKTVFSRISRANKILRDKLALRLDEGHITIEDMDRLLENTLPREEFRLLMRHIDKCNRCQSILSILKSNRDQSIDDEQICVAVEQSGEKYGVLVKHQVYCMYDKDKLCPNMQYDYEEFNEFYRIYEHALKKEVKDDEMKEISEDEKEELIMYTCNNDDEYPMEDVFEADENREREQMQYAEEIYNMIRDLINGDDIRKMHCLAKIEDLISWKKEHINIHQRINLKKAVYKMLKEKNPIVRGNAVLILGEMGEKSIDMRDMLSDADQRVRCSALRALEFNKDIEAIPILKELRKNSSDCFLEQIDIILNLFARRNEDNYSAN